MWMFVYGVVLCVYVCVWICSVVCMFVYGCVLLRMCVSGLH